MAQKLTNLKNKYEFKKKLDYDTSVSNSSAAMTVQSCGKSMFTLVVVAANQKFAKRVRPVCTPGLPYKDSLVYVVFDWRIYQFPRFYTSLAHLFALLNIKSYVYSFNVSDLFSHIQTAFNSSKINTN